MKPIKIIVFAGLLAGVMMTSCEKMMDVKSDRFVTLDQNKLNNPNDTLYSMFGILNKMQSLGDQYVVLGELRGDLADVTRNSDAELRELSRFFDGVSSDNSWVDISNYYVLINHCNYMIANADTSLYLSGEKVMLKEYAAAKVIRAWTYMQLALNYGKAYYVTKPILTVEEAAADYAILDRDALFDSIVVDLLEVENIPAPSLKETIGTIDYSRLFPSAKYLLGEIYLWQNNYELAASKYYELINEDKLYISDIFSNYWMDETLLNKTSNWITQLESSRCVLAKIAYYYTETREGFEQPKLTNMLKINYSMAPSSRAIELFENQVYTDMSTRGTSTNNIVTTGDLRGNGASYQYITKGYISELLSDLIASYGEDIASLYKCEEGDPIIDIYSSSNAVNLQRTSIAYLRYAEAVNRLNKPTWALAVINYGLSYATRVDSTKVNPKELLSGEPWLNFDSDDYSMAYGIRPCGMGASTVVSFPPEATTLQDSIDYVESIIVEELGLETAFGGNRFSDLMRISQHNPDGNNDIFASAIALKFRDSYDEVYNKAKNPQNWYLPLPSLQKE